MRKTKVKKRGVAVKNKKIICLFLVILMMVLTFSINSNAITLPWLEISSNNYLKGDKLILDENNEVEIEKTLQLYALMVYGNDFCENPEDVGIYVNEANLSGVTWTSNNNEIATVDNTGKVTGVAEGKTTITATYNGGSANYEIMVKDTTTTPVNTDSIEILDMKLVDKNNVKSGEDLCLNIKTSEEIDFIYFEILNNGHYYGYECELNNNINEYNIIFNSNQLFSAEVSFPEDTQTNDRVIDGYCHIENVAIRKKGGDWTNFMSKPLTGISGCEQLNYNIEFYIDSLPFKDIDINDWFYNATKYVYENNIIKGYNNTEFGPNDKLTRGQLVTILHRMEGSPKVTGTPKFTDVKDSTQYYYNAVIWATNNKIVSGYDNGKFGPEDNITREQLAVILWKYARYKGKNVSASNNLSAFKDTNKISGWALTQVKWAVGAGVISGNADKTLNPLGNATRAEVAAMLEKYCKKIGR